MQAGFAKLKVDGRVRANYAKVITRWKRTTCVFFTFPGLAEWLILHFKMGHLARQNESFCTAEWAILRCKTGHFEKRKEKSSSFVRFFYRNNSFRLRRMRKKVYPFFGMKCLQSVLSFSFVSPVPASMTHCVSTRLATCSSRPGVING